MIFFCKNRIFLVCFILLGLSLTIGFVLYALRSNIDLFYTPSEVIYGKGTEQIKPNIGQRLRLGGMVQTASISRAPESLKLSFRVYDLSAIVTVEYEGILPDLFREEQSVVVQGELRRPDLLIAKEVLAKHDENYMPAEIADAMKKNHLQPGQAYSIENNNEE